MQQQRRQQQQEQEQQEPVIYSVTDGLSSYFTKREYLRNFNHFLDCSELYPESLATKAREDPKFVESLIIKHIRDLGEKEKLTRRSIHVHCYAIFHFLEMNDLSNLINKKKVKRFAPPDESSRDDRAYTHEEIQQILLRCDERARVAILLMASTGMRVGALSTLQIKDLVKISDYHLYKITVYSDSPKERYYTFCTPECTAAIDSYLEYRKRFGEIIKPQAPLIREQFDIDDPFHIQSPKPLKHDGVIYIVKQALKRSGKKTKEVMQSHGFRKFAITMMKKAKVDFSDREYLVGHKHSRGLDVNYDRTTEEDRLQEYLKAVDLLTINSEHRLKQQIHFMKAEHSAEWQQLKEQMNELRSLLEHKV